VGIHNVLRTSCLRVCSLRGPVGSEKAPGEEVLFSYGACPATQAIVAKGVEFIRRKAESRKARETIGKQINSVILPANWTQVLEAGYHSAKNSSTPYSWTRLSVCRRRVSSWPTRSLVWRVSQATPPS
jgi:hypothetical protein